MPNKPSWLLRVNEILEDLGGAEMAAHPFLTRGAVEKLFGLKRRQAIELMHSVGGYSFGSQLRKPQHQVTVMRVKMEVKLLKNMVLRKARVQQIRSPHLRDSPPRSAATRGPLNDPADSNKRKGRRCRRS